MQLVALPQLPVHNMKIDPVDRMLIMSLDFWSIITFLLHKFYHISAPSSVITKLKIGYLTAVLTLYQGGECI